MPALSALVHREKRAHHLCTSIDSLDAELARLHTSDRPGIPPMSVTEVCGPPGAGKTAVVMALMLDALRAGKHVLWAAAGGRPFAVRRLGALRGFRPEMHRQLTCLPLSDLATVLVLASSPRARCDLLVIEHYNELVPETAASGRQAATAVLVDALSECASDRCVVVTSDMRQDRGAVPVLAPALATKLPRLLLYRDGEGLLRGFTPSTGSLVADADAAAAAAEVNISSDISDINVHIASSSQNASDVPDLCDSSFDSQFSQVSQVPISQVPVSQVPVPQIPVQIDASAISVLSPGPLSEPPEPLEPQPGLELIESVSEADGEDGPPRKKPRQPDFIPCSQLEFGLERI